MGRDSRVRHLVFLAVVAVEFVAIAHAVVAYGNPQNDHDFGNDVAIDSGGRVVVAGGVHNSGQAGYRHFAVWIFTPDGTPDVSFGSIGRLVPTGSGGAVPSAIATSVVIDREGRILATGSAGDFMAVWRFNADGTPDKGFNSTGFLTQYEPSVEYGAGGAALALDSAGRILVAGGTWNGSDSDLTVWRFNTDGTLDTTFNSRGFLVADSSTEDWGRDSGVDIALDSVGQILVVGQLRRNVEPGRSDAAIRLLQYHPDGTPDTSFGSGGVVTVQDAGAAGMATDDQGRIVLVGHVVNDFRYRMAVWRFLPGGEPDTTFDLDGRWTDDVFDPSFGNALLVDSGGRIIVVGETGAEDSGRAMTVWRFNPDGTPDTMFSSVGHARYSLSPRGRDGSATSVALDASGRIVITGNGLKSDPNGDNLDMVTWRLNPDGTLDTSFNGFGYLVRDGTGEDGGW